MSDYALRSTASFGDYNATVDNDSYLRLKAFQRRSFGMSIQDLIPDNVLLQITRKEQGTSGTQEASSSDAHTTQNNRYSFFHLGIIPLSQDSRSGERLVEHRYEES